MYSRLRPLLFNLDPERAHWLTLRLLQLVGTLPPLAEIVRLKFHISAAKPTDLFGLHFRNHLGLAAGYDKDGLAWRGLACLGFGHVEIGSVTPKPQPGNSRPRVFRLVEDKALINRMGFPSRGAQFVASRLRGPKPENLIVGVNLGINKDTPLGRAAEDYKSLMAMFSPLADYLVVNISSPNTSGLRRLQFRDHLQTLLTEIKPLQTQPLLVKLSPDLSTKELEQAVTVILDQKIDGVIATNTTIQRPGLKSRYAIEKGGLSGSPLSEISRQTIKRIHAWSEGKLPIIASGGIMSREDARAAMDAGASLVQVYSGLIYSGPGLVREILAKSRP